MTCLINSFEHFHQKANWKTKGTFRDLQADELSEEQVAQFRVAFKTFDKDDSGVITEDQLGDVMRSLGQAMTKLQVRTMVQEVDEDGNGQIEVSIVFFSFRSFHR